VADKVCVTSPRRRAIVLSVACLWGAVVLAGPLQAHAADSELAGEASRLVFHGWSTDSKWVAYTRLYPAVEHPGRDPKPAREQRMHRRIRKGHFKGFGKMVGGDVEAFAAKRGYDPKACERTEVSPRRFSFACPTGVFALEVHIGRTLGFSVERDGALVFRHTFDRLYVGFDPALYPSPDGRQAFLTFHLDSGWDVDAAVFPFVLPAPHKRAP